jgi:hypothetical protein
LQALALYRQSLTVIEREEWDYVSRGYDIPIRARMSDLSCRTIETRGNRLRERLQETSPMQNGNVDLDALITDPITGVKRAEIADRETREFLKGYGIAGEHRSLRDLTSLFGRFPSAQALNRIAWFYGELPDRSWRDRARNRSPNGVIRGEGMIRVPIDRLSTAARGRR